ncbi:DUF1212-domain-containing protein [Neoconidiobolus thromboides FSU 785]|nr:DUF1212-domain-containing protein [Neoconidiobolus thromboides FSU 785]
MKPAKKSAVKFMIGDGSDEEDLASPGSYTAPMISLSEPASPDFKPTQIILHGRPMYKDGLSSSMPKMNQGNLSPLNPSRLDLNGMNKNIEKSDGYPFPDMNRTTLSGSSTPNEETIEIKVIEEPISGDPQKMEAARLVRNITKKKLMETKGDIQPKKGILSNLLSLQQHQVLKSRQKMDPNLKKEGNKQNKVNNLKKSGKETVRGSFDESRLNIKGLMTPNSSYKSLTDFFGIGSTRSSFSYDDSATLNSAKKVTAAIEDILKRQNFIVELCKAFILYGAPSHRLENNMSKVAKVLDLDASFASLPGLMLISFSDRDLHTSETVLLRVNLGYDMYKLERVVSIYHRICKEDMHILDAISELTSIMEQPPLYPPWVELLNYGLGSFAMAPMVFGGGWVDAGVAGLLGLLVGLMMLLARRFEGYSNVFELSAAVLSAFIATVLHSHVCYWAVVLSATVNLLPGLSLTVAVVELASKNMVSGAVRMFYALVVAFILGFGLSLGVRLYSSFDPSGYQNDIVCSGISPWWTLLLFPMASISFNIFLMAHPKQWIYMSGIALLGYLTSYFTTKYNFSKDLVPALSAFVIGIASNLLARFTNVLPIIPLLGSVILLVPGSLGVKGSAAFLVEKSAEGASFAMQMIIIALSITVGLFFSTFVVYPMGRKRSTLMTF